jgi:predicted PurR-regulated permease PerM
MNLSVVEKTKNFIEDNIALLLLLLMLFLTYKVIGIFLGVFTFAIIFAVSFHGLFESVSAKLGNRRKLTATLYGILMVSLIALPIVYGISLLGKGIHNAQQVLADIYNHKVPPLPDFIAGIPMLGAKAVSFWAQLESNPQAAIGMYQPQLKGVLQHLLHSGVGLAGTSLELVLGIIASAIMLVKGKALLKPLEFILERLTNMQTGPEILDASGKAIRGVAIGVMGTGFIAAIAAFIGYRIAGIQIAPLLAAVTFLLVVLQIGPILVLIPAVLYLANTGQTGMAIFLSIYGLVVLMGIDNVLKPILIGRSGKLPILVLFIGVVGGMAVWGFTGLFKGAIVMAVVYTLFSTWYRSRAGEQAQADKPELPATA